MMIWCAKSRPSLIVTWRKPSSFRRSRNVASSGWVFCWKKLVARYDDEPSSNEGRKQLSERAKVAEEKRELSMARYHNYEFASAAFQIGIVLASATIITGMFVLAWISGLLGIGGLVLMGIGVLAPHFIHYVPFLGGH